MTLRILLLIHSSLIFISSFSQKFIAQKLATEKVDFFSNQSMISFSGGYYSITNSSKARLGYSKFITTLTEYDRQLKVIKTRELYSGTKRPVPFPSHFEKIDGKEIFIYYEREEKSNVLNVFTAEVDPEKLEFINSKKLLQIKGKTPEYFDSFSPLTTYKLIVLKSPDNQRTLFLWHSGIDNQFIYSVTDKNMNVIKNKTEEFKQTTSIHLPNAYIDNEGNVFVAYFYTQENKRVWNVIKEGMDDKTKTITIIIDNNILPVNVFISPGISNNEIRICGTYTTNEYYATGAFVQTIDRNTMTTSNLLKKAIPETLMELYMEDDFSGKKENKIGLHPEMTFTQLTLNDKTICLSGEITKIETVSRRAGNNSSFNNYVPVKSITKGSILNILFSETDILFNNIYKQTFSTDIVDKSGFYPFVYDNKVVFVYGLYKIDKADLGKYFAPSSLPDKIERTNSFFLLSTMNNKGELMSSKVVEDIDINGYGLEVQNILNNDVFPILLPFKRAALGLNESITYYSLQPSNK